MNSLRFAEDSLQEQVEVHLVSANPFVVYFTFELHNEHLDQYLQDLPFAIDKKNKYYKI